MEDVVETKPEVSTYLDAVASSLMDPADDDIEFDENPSWLREDIQAMKHLDRLKLMRAVPKQSLPFRPRSSQKATACDIDQLPSVLVHSKAEGARGRRPARNLVDIINNKSSTTDLSIRIYREDRVQRSLTELEEREQRRKHQKKAALARMSSTAALPDKTIRFLERRRFLAANTLKGTAAFCTERTLPRPQTAPNLGCSKRGNQREAFSSTKDDSDNKMISRRKKSPSPEKYRNREDERKQRAKVLTTMLMGWWYAKNLKITFDFKCQQMTEEDMAACVLQQHMRKALKRKRRLNAAKVVPLCLRRAIIRYRRRKYIGIVKSYLIECAKNQKSKIIRQFLYRVRRLQRLIKNWIATQKARVEVLKRYWERVEYGYRKGLADEYRAAQELLIENERKLKKRARAPIAELWSKANSKVCVLLKRAEKAQMRAARERAFEDNTEMPQRVHSTDLALGEFEGSIPEEIKLKVINETIKRKRKMFIELRKSEKIAATQALSGK